MIRFGFFTKETDVYSIHQDVKVLKGNMGMEEAALAAHEAYDGEGYLYLFFYFSSSLDPEKVSLATLRDKAISIWLFKRE